MFFIISCDSQQTHLEAKLGRWDREKGRKQERERERGGRGSKRDRDSSVRGCCTQRRKEIWAGTGWSAQSPIHDAETTLLGKCILLNPTIAFLCVSLFWWCGKQRTLYYVSDFNDLYFTSTGSFFLSSDLSSTALAACSIGSSAALLCTFHLGVILRQNRFNLYFRIKVKGTIPVSRAKQRHHEWLV